MVSKTMALFNNYVAQQQDGITYKMHSKKEGYHDQMLNLTAQLYLEDIFCWNCTDLIIYAKEGGNCAVWFEIEFQVYEVT